MPPHCGHTTIESVRPVHQQILDRIAKAKPEFRDCYQDVPFEPRAYEVDMGAANYIDSSALGMLLLLRDHAGGDQADVGIINCSADVRKILTISNFDQLFKIH